MKGEHEVYQRLGIVIYRDTTKTGPLLQARVME